MTPEQARYRLKEFKPHLSNDGWKECFQLAIDALENSIPKDPSVEIVDVCLIARCPCCNTMLGKYANYCEECGQCVNPNKFIKE